MFDMEALSQGSKDLRLSQFLHCGS